MRVVETLHVRSNSRTPGTDSPVLDERRERWLGVTPNCQAACVKDLLSTATEQTSAVGT